MRKVIVHYHLFKNAGTSIDSLLKRSFGEHWKNFDGEHAGARFSPEEFAKIIEENADLRAFSSHQIIPPLPEGDFQVFPIVFLRHPIDRIKSAYLFEWRKQLGLKEPQGSLPEYIKHKFEKHRANAIEEFHVITLANKGYSGRQVSRELSDEQLLGNAQSFIDAVPFFGIVERYEESIIRLNYFLKMSFPQFKPILTKENVTQDHSIDLSVRLSQFKEEVGDDLYEEVVKRNKMDLELYDYAVNKFDNILQ